MRLLNKNTARRAAAAAALLTMTAAMSVGAFAADAEDTTVAGYLPPQSSEVMVQGDIALHSDVPVGEVDPNYGGYASPVENPIQGNVMMISGETPLPSDTPVEKSEARYTVKGLLGKQVLYTARQEGRVLTLDAPDDNATFRTTILDMQTLMNQGVSTLVLKTGKTSTPAFCLYHSYIEKGRRPSRDGVLFRQSAKNSNNKLYYLPKIMPICEILLPKIYGGGGGIIYLEFPQGAGAE